ncbi:hypothetical protein MIND_00599400 [Mycena indigotica]|uniref:SAP domain-containing protein n=1 Tax=Mycena indigotica TaxID=2126181 RepID=A0A8H6STL2_9AGAR|nr:uncharacterized protein MIND_00599400 [Mycena indigotica]KAF7303700.1 hypothetical protein MIND_00599400 [Mycena indigotica]
MPASISEEEIAAAAKCNAFLFPAREGNGSEKHSLAGKSKNELQELLRVYNLPFTGNKPILEKRLQEFSIQYCADPANWCDFSFSLPLILILMCTLFSRKGKRASALRAHKGPREDTKKTKTKLSDTRRANIIDTERVTERSKDNRTENDKKDMREWAKRTCARLPYRAPPFQQQNPPPAQPFIPQEGPATVPVVPVVITEVADVSARLEVLESRLAILSSSRAAPWDCNPQPYEQVTATNNTFMGGFNDLDWSQQPQPVSAPPAPAPMDIDSTGFTYDIEMLEYEIPCGPLAGSWGRDHISRYWPDEIMSVSVPANSFAKDFGLLNEMWDDSSPFWKDKSLVQIRGRHIAIIHWRGLFKGTGQWSAHKSAWTEWKFLVERYRRGTMEDFWADFTRNGTRMNYTAILKKLREERGVRNRQLVEQARAEYGSRFSEVFSYVSSQKGDRVVMTHESHIAEEYKRLKKRDGIEID